MKHFTALKLSAVALCLATVALCQSLNAANADTDKEMNKFIDKLMSKMTLQEKIGQLNLPPGEDIVTGDPQSSNLGALVAAGKAGGTFNIKGAEKIKALQKLAVEKTRLGIPLLFGMDVIHGYETVFPIPIGLAATWDMEAIERAARISAKEASAAGICWTYSPMVDIARDPRWGRMAEGAGEDPYLGAAVSRAFVKGYQGKNLENNDEIMACVKHYALYGAAEGGRDYNTADMSRQYMYNYYFPPYKAAVEAGVGSIMSSFNTVDGVPATANKWLLTDVLRDQWGFDGFVVTDYDAINEMQKHGVAKPDKASVLALNAGTDMDMASHAFIDNLEKALNEGKISMEQIDNAVRRILVAKYRLGLFKNPYKYIDPQREKTEIYTESNRNEARKIAAESFVLLKNEGNVLPLKKEGKIALVGPMGNSSSNMPGTWSVAAVPSKYKTLLQGLKDAVGDKAEVTYTKGSNFYDDPVQDLAAASWNKALRDDRGEEALIAEALEAVKDADVIVAAMGEGSQSSGESASRGDLSLPDTQKKLLEAMLSTGKPVVMINFSGRATVMDWESKHVPAILNVWFGGSETGDAVADVIFGDVNPSGKLTVTLPRHNGQIPIHYNHLPTGRPASPGWNGFQVFRSNYVDMDPAPLYPFGYGLSYTNFKYSDFRISSTKMSPDGHITATVTVTNTGDRAGDEIVQFYINDPEASMSRPVKELKHFERISLKPGESRDVSFDITTDALKFYNYNLEHVAEPGEFRVMAGPDSERLSTLSFILKE